jgi:predicted RNase H-like nuclease (RuvC/YqgF family)
MKLQRYTASDIAYAANHKNIEWVKADEAEALETENNRLHKQNSVLLEEKQKFQKLYLERETKAEARIKELEKENSKLRKALKETKKQIQVLPWLGG